MLGGRYRLDERIAGGGMGDVWRATDEVLGRTVAVKVLLPALLEEPGFAERFRGEARTMATINHPGVVDVYDYGSENGTAFLVMEYIEGDALSRTLARVGRLTPARTMALIAQAADALHAAHEKGIVHRDVKPGNLLVRPNGTLVLTDFGIARSAIVGQLTQAGSVLGTASYISPEQAAGQGASPLSDVYALGVVAYQCLSGRRPFEGDNPLEIAMRHVRDNPPPLPPDIPPPARQIVETAMAKDPAARYPSAAAFGQIARHAHAQLNAGATGTRPAVPLGGPGSPVGPPGSPVALHGPVSGPPGAPTSGAPDVPGAPKSGAPYPTSGATGGYPAGPPSATSSPTGTRVLSGGAPGSGPPGGAVGGTPGGAAPGQFARGAAGVPPPPPRPSDTGYTYVGTGPVQPVGPHAQPPGASGPSGPSGPARPRRTGLVAALAAAGLLALVLFVGGGIFLVNNVLRDGDGGDNKPPPAASTQPQQQAKEKDIDCKGMAGKQKGGVIRALTNQGFKVKEKPVEDNRPAGTVLKVPCSAPEGSEVEVEISSGRGGNSGPGGEPDASCKPPFFGGIAPGPSCSPSPPR